MQLSDYIKTKEWRKKRLETFLLKWKKCMKCWSEKQIHVHHATYERIWDENISTDLFPLCKRCHEFFHKKYEWHFIKNTLEFISIKELPKYEPAKKVRTITSTKKKKKPKSERAIINKKKQEKVMKKKAKKQKEPYMWNTYSKTQWKEYKYKSFKL